MNPDSVSAQVPDIADVVSESTKASTTEVRPITLGRRNKRIKTNAQRCREYRERKKLQNTMVQNITAKRSDVCSETDQLPAKKPKTNAERRKKYYEAQKLKKQKIPKKIPKTAKQRSKEYYYRKKKFQALNTLNHHSDARGLKMTSECIHSTRDSVIGEPSSSDEVVNKEYNNQNLENIKSLDKNVDNVEFISIKQEPDTSDEHFKPENSLLEISMWHSASIKEEPAYHSTDEEVSIKEEPSDDDSNEVPPKTDL